MENTWISVVIPTYQRPQKVRRAVNSVLDQTLSDFEIIVVNDDPETRIHNALPDDDRIRCIQHEQNRGAPVARNNGIKAANGEYVALLDDDDMWKSEKLAKQINKFNSLDNSFGLVYTGSDHVYNGKLVNRDVPSKEGDLYGVLLGQNFIPSESPLIKKECFERVGLFDPDFPSCQDIDMWIRIAREFKIGVVDEPLAVSYLGHDDRISDDYEKKYQGHKRLIEKHNRDMKTNRSALAQQRRKVGLYAIGTGRNREGVHQLWKSFQYNPSNWPLILYIFMGMLPPFVGKKLFRVREEVVNRL